MTRLPPHVRAAVVARLIRAAEQQLQEELAREATQAANDTAPPARVGSARR